MLEVQRKLGKYMKFQKINFPPNVPLEASTAVATNLPKSFRGKSKTFLLKVRVQVRTYNIAKKTSYSHCSSRHVADLLYDKTSEIFMTKGRHFFRSGSEKNHRDKNFSQKLCFDSVCCSRHVECSCNHPAAPFAQNFVELLLNHRKMTFYFFENNLFKKFLWKRRLQLHHLSQKYFAGCLKTSSSKTIKSTNIQLCTLNYSPHNVPLDYFKNFFTGLLKVFLANVRNFVAQNPNFLVKLLVFFQKVISSSKDCSGHFDCNSENPAGKVGWPRSVTLWLKFWKGLWKKHTFSKTNSFIEIFIWHVECSYYTSADILPPVFWAQFPKSQTQSLSLKNLLQNVLLGTW